MTTEPLTPASNFGAVPSEDSDYKTSSVVILPCPYDGTATYRAGARFGPQAILSASRNMELFDEELKMDFTRQGICTLPPLEPDAGGPAQNVENIRKSALPLFGEERFVVGLGGDHSISIGLMEAALEKHPDLSILHLDAHADLRAEYQGSTYSHACVMRRFIDRIPVVQAGIRSLSQREHDFLSDRDPNIFYAADLTPGRGEIPAKVLRQMLGGLNEKVYITLDLDVLDPAYAPAVGTPEPGGIDYYQVLQILRMVAAKRRIIGGDVVELTPLPGSIQTDYLAAKLVYKLIGYAFNDEKK